MGGIYVGITSGVEKFMDIDLKDKILCEFIPISGDFQPIAFVIDDSLNFPSGVTAYIMRNSIAVYISSFLFSDGSMRLIAQREFDDCTVSVFVQGRVQVSIENSEGVQPHIIDYAFLSCKIDRIGDCIILTGNGRLAVFGVGGAELLNTPVSEVKTGARLSAKIPFFDCRKSYALCEWECGKVLDRVRYEIVSEEPVREELYLYSLFEGLIMGLEVRDTVTEELYGKLNNLRKFLGDYKSVAYVTEDVAGLCYKLRGNLYRVDYYIAEYSGGRISNVKERSFD